MIDNEIKREILGYIPDWRNDTNMSEELYDLLFQWTKDLGLD